MRGFSLAETIVVVSLTTLLFGAITSIIVFFYRTNASVLEQADAITSARRGIEKGMRDIREATYGDDGSYPVIGAGTSTITFFSDKDHDMAVERVRYMLQGTTLYRYTIEPTGSPSVYTGAETQEIISEFVRNTDFLAPIFTYFDSTGNDLGDSPLPIDIASVSLRLIVNVNPNRSPTEFVLTGSADLRNVRSE